LFFVPFITSEVTESESHFLSVSRFIHFVILRISHKVWYSAFGKFIYTFTLLILSTYYTIFLFW